MSFSSQHDVLADEVAHEAIVSLGAPLLEACFRQISLILGSCKVSLIYQGIRSMSIGLRCKRIFRHWRERLDFTVGHRIVAH